MLTQAARVDPYSGRSVALRTGPTPGPPGKQEPKQNRRGRFAMEFEGYCVKCRTKRTVKEGTVTKTSKGRPMAKGACPECGTTVTRFLSDKESKK